MLCFLYSTFQTDGTIIIVIVVVIIIIIKIFVQGSGNIFLHSSPTLLSISSYR